MSNNLKPLITQKFIIESVKIAFEYEKNENFSVKYFKIKCKTLKCEECTKETSSECLVHGRREESSANGFAFQHQHGFMNVATREKITVRVIASSVIIIIIDIII